MKRRETVIFTDENGDRPLFLKHLALRLMSEDEQGYLPASLGCRLLLQEVCERVQRKREKAVPGKTLAHYKQQSAQKVQTFLEKEGNFFITLSQVALVTLHRGHFSHSLDQIQEKNGSHRSLLQESVSVGNVEPSVFPAGPGVYLSSY